MVTEAKVDYLRVKKHGNNFFLLASDHEKVSKT